MVHFDLLRSKINMIMIMQVLDKVSQGLTVVYSHATNRGLFIYLYTD